ncbi:hypothetical protein Moror_2674 [Moniliophthora roreri MCA 2997]|uniref:Uncharacterized protein n=2 Tax=Moniliophthora roreri TaxID=221103 RepID=V2XG06_MONRO|nr:hypothetical protein Moror_2674 [Moniliophthora roreri MCA 2997]KAI3611670.1 hypothetical protein WG66_007749 [Moniliophthora roreri]
MDVQEELKKFGAVLDVEQQRFETGRTKFNVTFTRISDGTKALTKFDDPGLNSLPFNIGRAQEIVSSCPSEVERTAFNTVHIHDFVPDSDISLNLSRATQWLSVETSRLQSDNVLSLKFSTARDARLFLKRASDSSKPYSLPSAVFSQPIEAPLDRQKWLLNWVSPGPFSQGFATFRTPLVPSWGQDRASGGL